MPRYYDERSVPILYYDAMFGVGCAVASLRTFFSIVSPGYIFKLHCKKLLAIFPSPAGMSLTKLSLAGNNLIIPGQGEFGK